MRRLENNYKFYLEIKPMIGAKKSSVTFEGKSAKRRDKSVSKLTIKDARKPTAE